jgi:hypothetical protein
LDEQQLKPCVQFSIPSGGGGMVPAMASGSLNRKLNDLVYKKIITGCKTSIETRYTMTVWFKNESDITAFYLYWEVNRSYETPTTVYKPISKDPYGSKKTV